MNNSRAHRELRYTFGNQLLALRTRAALTQATLAEAIGVHRRTVQNWETGVGYPKAEALQRMIAVFLTHAVFTSGREHEEAKGLWELAAQDGSLALPVFDNAWFIQLQPHGPQAGTGTPPAERDAAPSGDQGRPGTIVDWGQALAAPALYGREAELETLHRWILEDRCRVIALVGIGGIGKSSLAITLARHVLPQFDIVLFRSLQNGPPLAELLDQLIGAVADQHVTPLDVVSDKIDRLVQLFRQQRCMLILDNFESLLQPGALAGTYRSGYTEYGALIQALSTRAHQSCLVITSREKPEELGSLEGHTTPVRTLAITGLDERACQHLLEAKEIVGTAADVGDLARLYGGNPLALQLVAEPIRELFGGEVRAFFAAGDALFSGVGTLLEQQLVRSTPLEQTILRWLAIERELVPFEALLVSLKEVAPQGMVLAALESLHHRHILEQAPDRPAFTLQPVILEYLTDQMVEVVSREIVAGQTQLLLSHPLIQATAKDYVRRSQEQMIAMPLLERLLVACGGAQAAERRLSKLLDSWRGRTPAEQGYGPGNTINLLRLLRGHLSGLDLGQLVIRQAYLQGVTMQDSSLSEAHLQDTQLSDTFGAIQAVAISGDGLYWAAAGRNGEVRLWEEDGRCPYRTWQAHAASTWACDLAFSRDGRTLASAGWDGGVKLWEVATGALLAVYKHPSHIQRVAFAPDGRLLASCGGGSVVWIWDLHSGTLHESLSHPFATISIAWSRDGQVLATGDRGGDIRLWLVDAAAPPICRHILRGHATAVNSLVFSPDGRTLASASWDGTVKLWGVADGALRETLTSYTDRVTRVNWSPDGRTLAACSSDSTIWLWDVESNSYRAPLLGHTASVESLAFTSDSRYLLSGGEDSTLRMWDITSEQCIRVIQGYPLALNTIDWSPDGDYLLSGGADGLVTRWDVTGATPPQVLSRHSGSVFSVGWSPDGRRIASSEWSTTINLLAHQPGTSEAFKHPFANGTALYGLAWSPDGQRLACGTHRRGVWVLEMQADRQRWAESSLSTWIRSVAWRPDGALLAGGGDDGAVYVWDAADGTLLMRLAGHHRLIVGVAWSPDGGRLASCGSGSEGGELFVWDVQAGVRTQSLVGHVGIVNAIAWDESGERLISGGGDGTLRWWDLQEGVCLHVSEAHAGAIHSIRRNPDGELLASCGDDGSVQLWGLRSGERRASLRRDRLYERLQIGGASGLSMVQKATLRALGAVDNQVERVSPMPVPLAPPGDEPAPIGRPAPRSLLPQLTPCVGRDAELDQLDRLLSEATCRLLTIVGPGGMGKTRLALELAARQSPTFADGVVLVELMSVGGPGQIASAIGDALGLSFADQVDPTAHLMSALQTRHLLMVLDGFDHLLDGAELLIALLAHAPRLVILVTSRERLNLHAEWLYQVEGLTYPQSEDEMAAASFEPVLMMGYSGVQLFVQRAAQLQPAFQLDEESFAAIARICRRVGGMPLAIELAAASLRTLPIAAIELQIRANLDALTTRHRDVPARHRSLRAVFDHSWALLNDEERAHLCRLAIFRGGWTADAAAQVAGASLPALTTLVDKSLVRLVYQHRPPPATRATRPGEAPQRYSMLETLREYAMAHLTARGERDQIQRGHIVYYLAMAERSASREDAALAESALGQLDDERDNLRASLQWAIDGGEHTLGMMLASALRTFWRRRGAASEGRRWLEELLAMEASPADEAAHRARLRAMQAAAWFATDQHDYARATQLFESVLLQSDSPDDFQVLDARALQARTAGQYSLAISLAEEVVAQRRASGDGGRSSGGLGWSLFLLALMRREQGDLEGASVLFETMVQLHRGIGDREVVALGLLGLSDIGRDRGDRQQLRTYGGQSLLILRQLGVQWAIGFALNNLALAALWSGDLTGAAALIDEAVALFREQQAEGSLAEVLITQGQIYHAQGDGLTAQAVLREALGLALSVGPRLFVAGALEMLAQVAPAPNQADLAVQLLAGAAALRKQLGTPIQPANQDALARLLAGARELLGAEGFVASWTAGAAMPLDQLLGMLPVCGTGPTRES